MARYDDILEREVAELRDIAQERVAIDRTAIEHDYATDDAAYAEYDAERWVLERRFETLVNTLRALFFDDVHMTREEYERRLKAYVEYSASFAFQSPPKGAIRVDDIDPKGPTHRFLDYRERLNAAEAREETINGT